MHLQLLVCWTRRAWSVLLLQQKAKKTSIVGRIFNFTRHQTAFLHKESSAKVNYMSTYNRNTSWSRMHYHKLYYIYDSLLYLRYYLYLYHNPKTILRSIYLGGRFVTKSVFGIFESLKHCQWKIACANVAFQKLRSHNNPILVLIKSWQINTLLSFANCVWLWWIIFTIEKII